MLVDLTVKEFLNKVAGSDPVPGGGSRAEGRHCFGFGGNGSQSHCRQERL